MILHKTPWRRCIGGLVLACLLNCGGNMTRNQPNDPCATAWQAIKAREFRDWHGLPEGCAYEDFDSEFSRLRDEYGQGGLGRKYVPARYRIHLAKGYDHHLKVWFREETISLIEIAYPTLPYPAGELLRRLGAPGLELDYHLDIMPVTKGAWVYPSRGLALFLDAGHGAVMGIALFHPCDPAQYLDEIHPDNQVSELSLHE